MRIATTAIQSVFLPSATIMLRLLTRQQKQPVQHLQPRPISAHAVPPTQFQWAIRPKTTNGTTQSGRLSRAQQKAQSVTRQTLVPSAVSSRLKQLKQPASIALSAAKLLISKMLHVLKTVMKSVSVLYTLIAVKPQKLHFMLQATKRILFIHLQTVIQRAAQR